MATTLVDMVESNWPLFAAAPDDDVHRPGRNVEKKLTADAASRAAGAIFACFPLVVRNTIVPYETPRRVARSLACRARHRAVRFPCE